VLSGHAQRVFSGWSQLAFFCPDITFSPHHFTEEHNRMTEPSAFDSNNIKLQPLQPVGLMEQFNLPPRMIAFIRRNQRPIWGGVIAVVVLSLGIAAYSAYRDHRAARAASALDAAMIASGDKRQLLEQVVQDYGATPSALWAKIELAFLEEREAQRAKAIARLEEVNASLAARSLLKPLIQNKLAGLYENEKQLDKAIAAYTELAAREEFAAEAYRALGRVNEQLGRKEEAAAMYDKYLELVGAQPPVQGKTDPIREMVQFRRNQLNK
jgi:predicted negative regulator of RcsB-dependent stress response